MSGQIFISYRRQESAWSARSLHARLCRDFDPNQIFMDLDAIALGEDFIEAIETTVARCDVLIAVIGHNWLTSKDEHGGRRLDSADDFVRMEIGTALKRRIRVIPVLVDGALMPRAHDLPEDLKALVRRNALAITGTSFEGDCQRLAGAIRQVLEKAAAEERERLAAEQRQREEAEARQREQEERLEAEQREKERLEAEQLENKRLEAEHREKERLAIEARQRDDKERLEAERLEKERLEAEKREKERLEAEQREKERREAEQRENERLEAEGREKERLEAERLEKEQLVLEVEELDAERRKRFESSATRKHGFPTSAGVAPGSTAYAVFKFIYGFLVAAPSLRVTLFAVLALLLIAGVMWFAGRGGQVFTAPAQPHYEAGSHFYNDSYYEVAIGEFNKAIKDDPDYAAAYYKRGLAYRKLGNEAQAQADLNKAKQLGYTGPK
jgi:hypothetical protein